MKKPVIYAMYDNKTNQAQILKVMIKEGRPLRPFEIREYLKSMNKTTIHNNLKQMLDNGVILLKEAIATDNRSYKFYYPQKIFLDPELAELIYGVITPLIKTIHNNTDYKQMCDGDCGKAIKENIKLMLRLIEIDIDGESNSIKRNPPLNKERDN